MDHIRYKFFKCVYLSQIILKIHFTFKLVPHGNVASDDAQCSQYGIDVLQMGGNAVDAAITTVLCNSVALPHLSGLGGQVKKTKFNL